MYKKITGNRQKVVTRGRWNDLCSGPGLTQIRRYTDSDNCLQCWHTLTSYCHRLQFCIRLHLSAHTHAN